MLMPNGGTDIMTKSNRARGSIIAGEGVMLWSIGTYFYFYFLDLVEYSSMAALAD
jgi:hypothetical protein